MVILFFNLNKSFSQQTLSGTVTENYNTHEPIPFVSILIKTLDGNIISFVYTDKDGFYTINLPSGYMELIIETSILSHHSENREIKLIDRLKNDYKLDFHLEVRLNEIEEVFIQGKKELVKIESDTTTYNINNFKDGSERVVEDLLKNLPGISIAENGSIKFKGKNVIRVLLDGDNIFNSNYSIGTKNIDSEIIESIQAFEDYNVNPLLKGVKTSDDVAINLVLKNGVSDFSGNAEAGIGIKDKINLKTNSVIVSKALKGFATINYNNTGENSSPFYLGSNTAEISKLNEAKDRAENFFNLDNDNSILPINKTSDNNNFFGSANSLIKLNKKISIRVNYSLFSDKLINNNSSHISYLINDDQINVNSQETNSSMPIINSLEYEFIYNVNNKSRLTSLGKLEIENTTQVTTGFNNENNFESIARSKDVFIKNWLEYTHRINNKNILIFSGNASSNDIPQELSIESEIDDFEQEISSRKKSFGIQSSFFHKNNNMEFSAIGGVNNIKNYLSSELEGGLINQISRNDLSYNLNNPFLNLTYFIKKDPWNLALKFHNDLSNIEILDMEANTALKKTSFIFNPSLSINYKTNKVSSFFLRYNLSGRPPNIRNIFSNQILITNRDIIKNDFNFIFFNTHLSEVGYKINDFYNLFQLNTYARHSFDKKGIIRKFEINENYNIQTSILSVTNNENLEFGFNLEKYIHPLRTTINLNSSYSLQDYQNKVNNIEIRENVNRTFFGELNFRTGFKGKLNFENKLSLRQNSFNNQFNSNSFTSFKNQFDIKWISDRFHFTLNNLYVDSDLSSKIKGNFLLDGSFGLQTKNKKTEFILKASNILNNKKYNIVNSSDFYNSVFEQSLVERFVLFSIKFKY